MGQAFPFCVDCADKRGCDSCTDLHNWIMEHMETKRADQASGDLISRDALLKDGIRVEYGYNDNGLLMIPMRDVRKSIKNAPAIDAVPVVHSFWIGLAPGPHPGIGYGICGHCHQRITLGDHKSRCPNCGAIMDQEAPENG